MIQLIFNGGSFDQIKKAIAAGANINGTDNFGTTPLMVASIAYNDNNQLVSYYVEQGADLTAKDFEGRTALDYALLGFNQKIITLLKSKHAPQGTNLFTNAINNFNLLIFIIEL